MGKARRADIVIFSKWSELGKNHDTAGPLGLKKSWRLCNRGTSSPGIHCAGPLGLKNYCRPAGPEEELEALQPGDFVPRHPLCRPVGPEELLSARWA
jgi:hypothetical protein